MYYTSCICVLILVCVPFSFVPEMMTLWKCLLFLGFITLGGGSGPRSPWNTGTSDGDVTVSSYSYTNESDVRKAMFASYSDSIRPVINQNDTVNVHFKLELLNIECLEVTTQTLISTIWVVVKWVDEKMQWDKNLYDGASKFFVHDGDYNDVWKPDLSVSNTIDTFEKLGDGDVPIVVNSDGGIIMEAGKVLKTHCEVDMSYYPFDSQTCDIMIGAWVYSMHEVNMTTENVNLDNYRPNGEWAIVSTKAERHDMVFDNVPQSVLWFTFNFTRRPPFFTMHIVLPMLFLSVLNIIVFVLPPDAGEKMSLAITNLLSFAVFLTLFSDYMPHSSKHTPVLSVYLAVTFIISVFTVVVSTLVLRLHFRDGPVPNWVGKLYCGYLSRVFCFRVKTCPVCSPGNGLHNGPTKTEDKPKDFQNELSLALSRQQDLEKTSASQSNKSARQKEEQHVIDWKTIARITDWMAFILFLVVTVLVGTIVVGLLTMGS